MAGIKLTQYSHGAGCGCKISPKILHTILHSDKAKDNFQQLLVGYDTSDDAAVYDIQDGTAIISTTDFFMPIVDDAFAFGQIAAANAISDVYAMGGTPFLAIAILGWPLDKLAPEVAQQVLEGGRDICRQAGIALAGGHSIDSPEPIFGLAVTGRVPVSQLKRNNTATKGCHLILTKPIGVGILTTAQKKGLLLPEHEHIAPDSMKILNRVGSSLSTFSQVRAMTDVTGFGLLGHLIEMCEGSGLSAIVRSENIPVLNEALPYIDQKCIPGGTYRNWDSYGHKVSLRTETDKFILCDPQTSGGLLLAVEESGLEEVVLHLGSHGIAVRSFGQLVAKDNVVVRVV